MFRELLKYKLIILVYVLSVACDDIIESDISEDVIIIQSPSDSLETKNSSIGFLWEANEGAKSYQIQVVKGTFNNIISFEVDSTQESTYYEASFEEGNYQWRVKGLNNGYETAFTVPYSFTVLDSITPLDASELNLTLPLNNDFLNSGLQEFRWTDVVNAEAYIFKIIGFSEYTDTVSIGYLEKSLELEEGGYQWQIRAFNDNSEVLSELFTFTIDDTAPLTPTIDQPFAGDTLNISDSLKWTRRSADVEYDMLFIYEDSLAESVVEGFPLELDESYLNLDYNNLLSQNEYYYFKLLSLDSAANKSDTTSLTEFYITE